MGKGIIERLGISEEVSKGAINGKTITMLQDQRNEVLETLIGICDRIEYLGNSVGCRQSLLLLKDASLPIIEKATNKSWEEIKGLL